MWGSDPLLLEEDLCNCDILSVWELLIQGCDSDYTLLSPPLLLISLWFLLYIFRHIKSSLLVFRLLCKELLWFAPGTGEFRVFLLCYAMPSWTHSPLLGSWFYNCSPFFIYEDLELTLLSDIVNPLPKEKNLKCLLNNKKEFHMTLVSFKLL